MAFIVSPTKRSDFDEIGKTPPYRLFGLTARNEHGQIIGFGGVAYLEDGRKMAFADLTEEARKHKVALHKAGKQIMDTARRKGVKRLIAMADMEASPAAERWLKRFGFRQHEVNGAKIWEWVSDNG